LLASHPPPANLPFLLWSALQLVLASYALLALLSIESILVYQVGKGGLMGGKVLY